MEIMIELKDIHFSYNHSKVINGIGHLFDRGSFSAVIGPNGSGKSTLLRLMNRILRLREGEILIEGRNIDEMSIREISEKIAYVPQFHYSVFPATVFDTVLLGRNPFIRWSPGIKDRIIVTGILEKLHLDDIALKDINQLSGGQRQKVFIARALAQQPSIILLDEPTSSLDIRHQHEVMELLSELSRSGITIVMAIHDLNQAIRVCRDFIILSGGKIAARGGREVFTEELLEKVYSVKVRIFSLSGELYVIPA